MRKDTVGTVVGRVLDRMVAADQDTSGSAVLLAEVKDLQRKVDTLQVEVEALRRETGTSGSADGPPRRYYTPAEVAAMIGLSVKTVRRAITRGELQTVTYGRRRLVTADEFAKFIDAIEREGGRM